MRQSGGSYWYSDAGRWMSYINGHLSLRPGNHVIGDDGEPHDVYDGVDDPFTPPYEQAGPGPDEEDDVE